MKFTLLRRAWRLLHHLANSRPRHVEPARHHPEPLNWPDDTITAANLGHATVLMNFHGLRVVSDPVLGSHCGVNLGPWIIGPKRFVRPALRVTELPPLDLILLTHAHFDHFDRWTLRRLQQPCVVVTAAKTADLLRGLKFARVIELGWGESVEIETPRGAVTVRSERLRHWGARLQNDDFRGFNSYLLERAGRRICLAGDTAFTDAAQNLRRPGGIDLMALPIAAYHPWVTSHCNPEEAIAMADLADARALLPIHYGTFKLSWEPMDEPIARFRAALARQPSRIATGEIGETFRMAEQVAVP